jgi:hypothetical protein
MVIFDYTFVSLLDLLTSDDLNEICKKLSEKISDKGAEALARSLEFPLGFKKCFQSDSSKKSWRDFMLMILHWEKTGTDGLRSKKEWWTKITELSKDTNLSCSDIQLLKELLFD